MHRSLKKPAFVLFVVGLVAGSAGVALADSRPTEVAMEKTFEVAAGGELRVDVPDADVDLRTGSAGEVMIRVMIGGKDLNRVRQLYDKMNFRASADGGSVTLEADALRGINWGSWGNYSIVAVIELPERFDVDIHTSDGDIRVEALDGDVILKSSDGDIEIGRLHGGTAKLHSSDGDLQIREVVATDLELHTSDGDIEVGMLDGNSADIETSDGDIDIRELRCALSARSGDGDIAVGIEVLAETTLRTGDGDISIRLRAGTGADVDLSGEEIELRSAVTMDGKRSDGSAVGRLNGGGPLLKASSGDGTVSLGER